MPGRKRKQQALAAEGRLNPLRLDPVKAQTLLQRVNDSRARLHERMLDLRLFGTQHSPPAQANPGDHPLLQILFQLRDELAHVHQMTMEDAEKAKARVTLLSAMARTTESLTSEASRASVEIARIAETLMAHEQRVKEHEDRMELAREKAEGVKTATTAADLFAILEDADAAALPKADGA